MGLQRNAQIGILLQADESTIGVLGTADYAGNRKESSHSYAAGSYDRGLQRGKLTKQRPLRSMYGIKIGWTEEAVGGTASLVAPWHSTVQACGMDAYQLKKQTFAAGMAGEFQVGDRIGNNVAEGAATAKGVVAYIDTRAASRRIWYYPTLGASLGAADVVTNYSRVGSLTLNGAAANGGFQFRPLSETDGVVPECATIERRINGQLHRSMSSRGNLSLTMKQEEPLLLKADFEGIPIFADVATRTPNAGAFLAGVTEYANPPKVSMGIPFYLRVGANPSFTPIMTELSVNLGNQIAPRPTITNRDLASSGHVAPRISDRTPTATIDPEHVLPAEFDFIGNLLAGAEFRMSAEVGSIDDANNGLVVVAGGKIQAIGDYEEGEREGISTVPYQVGFFGDNDDEIVINHCF